MLRSLVVGIALFGPFFAPYSPTEFDGRCRSRLRRRTPPFGTDTLGRDILSGSSGAGARCSLCRCSRPLIGVVLGTAVGLVAAYSRGYLDDVLMRTMDVILSFPQIVFALVLAATVGPQLWLLVLAVGLDDDAPRRAGHARRRGRGRGTRLRPRGRGDRRAAPAILLGEVLPNITSPLVVETSLRLTFNIAVVAGLSFLGFGHPAAGARTGAS